VLFHIQLDPHQMSFAFSEVQAHVNYMLRRGELAWVEGADDVERVVAPVRNAPARKRPTAAPGRQRRAGSP